MGVKVRIVPQQKGQTAESFTFPAKTAELTDDIVKHSKIGPALRRIADQLVKQYKVYQDRGHGPERKVVGVEFTGLDFIFMLEPEEKKPCW